MLLRDILTSPRYIKGYHKDTIGEESLTKQKIWLVVHTGEWKDTRRNFEAKECLKCKKGNCMSLLLRVNYFKMHG